MLQIKLYKVDFKPDHQDVFLCTENSNYAFADYLYLHELNSDSIEIEKIWSETATQIALVPNYENANYMRIIDTNSNIPNKYYFISSIDNKSQRCTIYNLQFDAWHTFMSVKNNFEIKPSILSQCSKPLHNEIVLQNTSNVGTSSGVYTSKNIVRSILEPRTYGTLFFIIKGTKRSFLFFTPCFYENILQHLYAISFAAKTKIISSGAENDFDGTPLKCYFIPEYSEFKDEIILQYQTPSPYMVQDVYLLDANNNLMTYTNAQSTRENITFTSVLIERNRNTIFAKTLVDNSIEIDNKHKWTFGTYANHIDLPNTCDTISYTLKFETDLLLDFRLYAEINKENIIDFTSDFEIPFSTSEFEQWYNRNQASLQAANTQNKIQVATSLIMAGASLAAAPITAGASMFGTVGGITTAAASGITFNQQQAATIEAARKQPAIVNSFYASGFLSIHNSGIEICKYTASNDAVLNTYENAYGVLTDTYISDQELKSLLEANNYDFIYLKFRNIKLTCNGTKTAQLQELENILNHGVRVWLYNSNKTTYTDFANETKQYNITAP